MKRVQEELKGVVGMKKNGGGDRYRNFNILGCGGEGKLKTTSCCTITSPTWIYGGHWDQWILCIQEIKTNSKFLDY